MLLEAATGNPSFEGMYEPAQSLLDSVCPEKANFEILNFYKATTCFMKTCYGFSLFSEIELSTGCYG